MAVQQVKLVNFGVRGLLTVGYTLFDQNGSPISTRTGLGVYELSGSTGIYGASIPFTDGFIGSIVWDTGQVSPLIAAEDVFLPPTSDIRTLVSSSVSVPTIVSGVWNASASSFGILGTMGQYQNTLPVISQSVSFIQGIEAGTWIISGDQMIFYASGTNVELARFDLQDINGIAIDPTTSNPFRRVRV